jgi:hypothetical protein
MKTEIYLNRLRCLSIYFQQAEITEYLNGLHTECASSNEFSEIDCFEWAFWHLTFVFPRNWKTDDLDRPYYIANPTLSCLEACCVFFNLNISQACTVFAPSYSYEDLMGLPNNAGFGQIAHQLHWLLVGLERELNHQQLSNKKNHD